MTQRLGLMLLLVTSAVVSCSHTYTSPKAANHPKSHTSLASAPTSPLIELMRKARAGDAVAQHLLAEKYQTGSGIAKDSVKSAYWDQLSANEGNAQAQFDLFADYLQGQGLPQDDTKSMLWLKGAAAHGSTKAQILLGEYYWIGASALGIRKDRATAIHWWQTAARRDPYAQLLLSQCYEHGGACPKDPIKAATLYQAAMAHADKQQLWEIGDCYANGTATCELDAAIALQYYKKAAQADAQLQWKLGDCFASGFSGCTKDKAKAADWYEAAASHGSADLQEQLGWCYNTGFGCPLNFAKAIEWYSQAAAQGNVNAMVAEGKLYENGEQVWKAFAKGDLNTAASDLDSAHFDITKNLEKAFQLFEKAAALGNSDAIEHLAGMYDSGDGVIKNGAKAAELYIRAASQGDADAQFTLAVHYAKGLDVARDLVLAYAWADVGSANTSQRVGSPAAVGIRDELERQMSQAQVDQAQQLAAKWKLGVDFVHQPNTSDSITERKGEGLTPRWTGTMFVVSLSGLSITNDHVVHGCRQLQVKGRDGAPRVIATDGTNDLALVQLPWSVSTAATIGSSDTFKQGDSVVVFGYPLNGILATGGNLTTGVISALTGMRNNSAQIQITAPIQPGSSGSPVMNDWGDVIAVVSAKLSDRVMANATGAVGENLNFAVSGRELRAFLDANDVKYARDDGGWFRHKKSLAEIADTARKWTYIIECLQ